MSSHEHIGLLAWDYAAGKGGMGASLMRIVRALHTAGMTVIVGSPKGEEGDVPLLPTTLMPGGHLLFSLLLPFQLRRFIAHHCIKTVVAPVGPGGVFLVRRPTNVRFVAVVYHTYEQQRRLVPGERWKSMFMPFERATLRRADLVLCFSEDTRRSLIDRIGIPAERIRLLPHGIDLDAWKPLENRPPHSCVFVGRADRRKGIDALLHAWPIVRMSVPDATLTIVGRGRAIQGPGIRRIERCSFEELTALVGSSAVSVCPSHLEGFGLAIAESMTAGCAVIGSDADGVRRLIAHEQTGLLVPPGDAVALAAAMIRLMADEAFRKRLGRDARAHALRAFDPAASDVAMVEAVRSVTRGHA